VADLHLNLGRSCCLIASACAVAVSIAIVMAAFTCCFCGTTEQDLRTLCKDHQGASSCQYPAVHQWFRDYILLRLWQKQTHIFPSASRGGKESAEDAKPCAQARALVDAPHHLLPSQLWQSAQTQLLMHFWLYSVAKWCVVVAGRCCHAVGSGRGQAAVQSGCW